MPFFKKVYLKNKFYMSVHEMLDITPSYPYKHLLYYKILFEHNSQDHFEYFTPSYTT